MSVEDLHRSAPARDSSRQSDVPVSRRPFRRGRGPARPSSQLQRRDRVGQVHARASALASRAHPPPPAAGGSRRPGILISPPRSAMENFDGPPGSVEPQVEGDESAAASCIARNAHPTALMPSAGSQNPGQRNGTDAHPQTESGGRAKSSSHAQHRDVHVGDGVRDRGEQHDPQQSSGVVFIIWTERGQHESRQRAKIPSRMGGGLRSKMLSAERAFTSNSCGSFAPSANKDDGHRGRNDQEDPGHHPGRIEVRVLTCREARPPPGAVAGTAAALLPYL